MNKPFVVVYFCTESEPENVYDSDFYRKAYSVLDDRYINNLRALYVVHGNFKLKVRKHMQFNCIVDQMCHMHLFSNTF